MLNALVAGLVVTAALAMAHPVAPLSSQVMEADDALLTRWRQEYETDTMNEALAAAPIVLCCRADGCHDCGAMPQAVDPPVNSGDGP